jgi:hypothetical protein
VQKELGRVPIDSYTHGDYRVEVYGWRAGLPTKTHKYFAVYTPNAPYIFLRHYMNVLDTGELQVAPVVPNDPNTTDAVASSESPPEPGEGKKGKGKRGKGKEPPAAEGAESSTAESSEKQREATPAVAEAATSEKETPKSEPKPDDKPALGEAAPAAEKQPAEPPQTKT